MKRPTAIGTRKSNHKAPPLGVLNGERAATLRGTEVSSWFIRPVLAALLSILLILFVGVNLASAAQATATWVDRSSGNAQEDYFVLERKMGAGSYFVVGHPPRDATSFVDTQVIAGNTYTWRIKAVNAMGESGYSNDATFTVLAATAGPSSLTCRSTPGTPSPALIAAINFQPSSSSVPSGYLKDDGLVYTVAWGYGWSVDNLGNTRDRDVNADQRLDTMVFVWGGTTNTWRYNLPNGSYLISLAAGDAAYAQGPHHIAIEGVVVVNNISTEPNGYITRTDIPVTVSDGQLTVLLGGAGAGNTTLNYLEVKQ